MVVLASRPGAAATEVVDSTGLDKMSVSRAIAGLAKRGRLRKAADPADGRRVRLTLSAEGMTLFRRIGSAASRREALLFGKVPAAEQARLGRTLDGLIAALRSSEAE
jgi:DNA-binding MarR family transcriptional regulator